MHSLVLVERSYLDESLLANPTSEWPIYLVGPLVFVKNFLGVEYLLAVVFGALEEHLMFESLLNKYLY